MAMDRVTADVFPGSRGLGGLALSGLDRVFVCDDSADYRYILREVLSEEGARIVGEAGDGRECLQAAPAADPTVVLLDVNMPAMTGWEVLPWLRRKLPDAKIVMLSSLSAEGLEQRALWMGADAYVTKPIDAFELPQLLRDKLAS
jgi:CheY-like chemotaxis protein